MEKATEKLAEPKRDFVSDELVEKNEKPGAESPAGVAGKIEEGSAACPMQAKGWLKGAMGMAVCCAAPLLLFAAIPFFGLSLGAIASGALSLVVLLACPVGMFLMMRMMMKNKN
jgi:hypothetical protein